MQTVEDILYTSREEGIYEIVMEHARSMTKLPENKHKPASEIYHDAYLKAVKDKVESRTWESALISCTEYQYHKKELIIEFHNGSRYKYTNFSNELYDSFMAAESKGKFFLTEIRNQFRDSENTEKL